MVSDLGTVVPYAPNRWLTCLTHGRELMKRSIIKLKAIDALPYLIYSFLYHAIRILFTEVFYFNYDDFLLIYLFSCYVRLKQLSCPKIIETGRWSLILWNSWPIPISVYQHFFFPLSFIWPSPAVSGKTSRNYRLAMKVNFECECTFCPLCLWS